MGDDYPVREPELPSGEDIKKAAEDVADDLKRTAEDVVEELKDKGEDLLDRGGSCLAKECSPDDLALVSVLTGVMGLVLAGAPGGVVALLHPVLSGTALVTGFYAACALNPESQRAKTAIWGLVLGGLGAALFILRHLAS